MMITTHIPLYNHLTVQEQKAFLDTATGQRFNNYIIACHKGEQTAGYDPMVRRLIKGKNTQKIGNYLSEQSTHPIFLRLKTQIITKFFPGIHWTNEPDILSQRPYSQNLLNYSEQKFRNRWISEFLADDSQEAKTIQNDVFKQYNEYFGFIFKEKQSLEKLLVMAYDLQFKYKTNAERMHFLNKLILSEWPTTSSFYQVASSNVRNSLRWLLGNSTQKVIDYVHDIAHAHAVYRFFGLSSESMILGVGREGLCMNFLDMYNYNYNRSAIAEGLGILQSLQIPLRSFFDEYVEISKFEKNPLYICSRSFIPFLVMGVILTCVYTLLLPLAGHVFLEYLLFIPTLYLSIAASSLYIDYKNSMYTVYLTWWYGSLYNAPQFQSNERIDAGFQNDVILSRRVAEYYAHSFEECDRIEQKYALHANELILDEIKHREENLKYKFDLYMEWYDLHDRQNLGVDIIHPIVIERLEGDRQRLEKKIKLYSGRLFPKESHSFFKKPALSEPFNTLKNKLLIIEDLKSDVENNFNGPESHERQERKLSAFC